MGGAATVSAAVTYYLHFKGEETEAQRSQLTCPYSLVYKMSDPAGIRMKVGSASCIQTFPTPCVTLSSITRLGSK